MGYKLLTTAWNAQTAVEPCAGQAVGGLETFAWSLSKSLAALPDVNVVFCIRSQRPVSRERVDGVTLSAIVQPWQAIGQAVARGVEIRRRFPWLKVRRWQPNLLWQLPAWAAYRLLNKQPSWTQQTLRVLQNAEPSIVLALGVNQDSAAAVTAARQQRIPVVVWLQSNCDLEPLFFGDPGYRDRNGVTSAEARICLEQADYIICQTDWQARLLKAVSPLPHCVIRNPVDTVRYRPGPTRRLDRKHVLWIGRYDDFHKRPLLALQVAQACPEIPFLMVINPGDERIRQEVLRVRPPNVTIQDYIPNDQMPLAFQESRCYLHTGSLDFEGFPNVQLEAAATGTPIVSLHDFDGFLQRSAAGRCAHGDLDLLAHQLQEVWNCDHAWQSCSLAGIDDVLREHSLDRITGETHQLLQELILHQSGSSIRASVIVNAPATAIQSPPVLNT